MRFVELFGERGDLFAYFFVRGVLMGDGGTEEGGEEGD